jgi:pyridoxal phosphate enzyme (YggS family)
MNTGGGAAGAVCLPSTGILESIAGGLASVKQRVSSTCARHSRKEPRLVAVTKTKPVEMILHAYEQGQRHFGENYVQELVEKSQHPSLVELEDICWHFIGHLQRNKCNNLVSCPHIWAVETVDSERLASALNTSWGRKATGGKLRVFVQVNTSEEQSKHGSGSEEAVSVARHVLGQCTNLKFMGLMTIGRVGHDYSTGPNPDFECLMKTRTKVCQELNLDVEEVELSMGMSSDFEHAISAGSTNIRVGSVIFGAREPKKR